MCSLPIVAKNIEEMAIFVEVVAVFGGDWAVLASDRVQVPQVVAKSSGDDQLWRS